MKLSELVWSPNEGLSLRVAQSSLEKKKASLRWSTETFNMVLPSPQESSDGRSSDNRDCSLGDIRASMLQRRSCSEGSMRAAMPCLQRSADVKPSFQRQWRLEELRSCGGSNVWNQMEEVFGNNHQHKRRFQQEVGICSSQYRTSASHHRASCSGPAKVTSSRISMQCFRQELESAVMEKGGPCAYRAESSRQQRKTVTASPCIAKSVEDTGGDTFVLPSDSTVRISPTSPRPSNCRETSDHASEGFSDGAHNRHKSSGLDVGLKCHDECQDENLHEMTRLDPALAGSLSACNLYSKKQEKGKEKILYSGDGCTSAAKESDDSNESIESCPSTKLILKRKITLRSDFVIPLGSKRARKDGNESACSGPLRRNGSSFFNWISKLTNGLDMVDKSATRGQQLTVVERKGSGSPTTSNEDKKMVPLRTVGFGPLFQSICSRNLMISPINCRLQSRSNDTGVVANQLNLDSRHSSSSSSAESLLKKERLHRANLQSSGRSVAAESQNQLEVVLPLREVKISSSKPGNLGVSNSSNKSSSGNLEGRLTETCGRPSNLVEDGREFLESSWITRLLPKVQTASHEAEPCKLLADCPFQKPDDVANAVNKDCGKEADCIRECTDEKVAPNIDLTMPLQEVKKPEGMVSNFARSHCSVACRPGPSEVKKVGDSSFVVNFDSRHELETSLKTNSSPTKGGRVVLLCEGKQEIGQDISGHRQDLSGHRDLQELPPESVHKLVNGQETSPIGERCEQNEADVQEISSSRVNISGDQIIPYCSYIPNAVAADSVAIFEAVQGLRLSRTDIIRWLKSPTTYATLDGFFLRLRLGKWQEALGGTGYHVARINGAADDNSLSVSIRNSQCIVDSRFVSNNDFLEDELKAWWSSVLNGECKLPSEAEMSSKLRERELFR